MMMKSNQDYDDSKKKQVASFGDIIGAKKQQHRSPIQSNFKTCGWESYTQGDIKRSISQVLSTKSSLDSLSHVRRIEISFEERASVIMRQIHPTQLGYICPCQTLEGSDVGVIKYISSTCMITPCVNPYNRLETHWYTAYGKRCSIYQWIVYYKNVKGFLCSRV